MYKQFGILKAGETNERLVRQYGEYPEMFVSLLGYVADHTNFRAWSMMEGKMPDSPQDCDAWIVTGSKHGVYDPLPWIEPGCEFVRSCIEANVPVLGVCFGHQLLAKAMGGRVEKSERGWTLGRQTYNVVARPDWMEDAPEQISFRSIHQDQIVEPPPGATLVARSDQCPYAMMAYGDCGFTIQAHPEFSVGFTRALYTLLREDRLPSPLVDEALPLLDLPTDNKLFARWAALFLGVEWPRPRRFN